MTERHRLYDRMGCFTLTKKEVEQLPDWVQQMMARVIVLRAEYKIEADAIEYLALCPQFEQHERFNYPRPYRPVVEDGRFLRFET